MQKPSAFIPKNLIGLCRFCCGKAGRVFRQFDVLALGAVADFGAQNCQYTTKVDAR
jgi:hypothetical protein